MFLYEIKMWNFINFCSIFQIIGQKNNLSKGITAGYILGSINSGFAI